MTKVVCNLCGKTFGIYDCKNIVNFDTMLPYGSKYDGMSFNIDLCPECCDKVIDLIRPLCKFDPLNDSD